LEPLILSLDRLGFFRARSCLLSFLFLCINLLRRINTRLFNAGSKLTVASNAPEKQKTAQEQPVEEQADAQPDVRLSAKLATRAVTGYPTALRWLKIHHPELLVSKPDEASVAPVAVAPAVCSRENPRCGPRYPRRDTGRPTGL
jgi:hypothetical protein